MIDAADPTQALSTRRAKTAWPWLVFALVALALCAGATIWASRVGSDAALDDLEQRGRASAALNVTMLEAELDKQRAAAFLVSRDSTVAAALATQDQSTLGALSAKLEALNAGTRANVIYILNLNGRSVAASNYRTPQSFVGTDYFFRDYFSRALNDGSAEFFALGTVSGVPGLYLSQRIDGPAGPLGVVVVKVEFSAIETGWQRANTPVYITDDRGIVLLANDPSWHFWTTMPVTGAAAAQIRESLQFGNAPLLPLPIEPLTSSAPVQTVIATLPSQTSARRYLRIAEVVPSIGWTLNFLVPIEPERANRAGGQRALALIVLIPLLLGAALVLWRAQAGQRGRRRAQMVQQALEAGIAARTAQLQTEMDQRAKAEAREATMREELQQANRLAILGQIVAGVAHEINQPVGAIRAYAENGQVLLARGDTGTVNDNLGAIARLTGRIGTITEQLRGFARKGQKPIGPTDIGQAIASALTLLGSRIRSQNVQIALDKPDHIVFALADSGRLEQVIVNLVQNGLEAMEGLPTPTLTITLRQHGDTVTLAVADTGAGIAPDIAARLFTPFSTSKAQGLGLGLVICNDIITAFGGRIEAGTAAGGGAVFTITLQAAP